MSKKGVWPERELLLLCRLLVTFKSTTPKQPHSHHIKPELTFKTSESNKSRIRPPHISLSIPSCVLQKFHVCAPTLLTFTMASPSPPLSPTPPLSPLPEAGHDPSDPNQPDEDFHDPPVAPAANPTADMDDLSDAESVLSDIDEAQFEDFDPNQITIEERPAIAVDEDNVKLIGRHKRKRDGELDGESKKKQKEGRREKVKKSRRKKDSDDDDFSGGQEMEGKRVRKKKTFVEGGDGRPRKEKPRIRKATPENEEALDPEERMFSGFGPLGLHYITNNV